MSPISVRQPRRSNQHGGRGRGGGGGGARFHALIDPPAGGMCRLSEWPSGRIGPWCPPYTIDVSREISRREHTRIDVANTRSMQMAATGLSQHNLAGVWAAIRQPVSTARICRKSPAFRRACLVLVSLSLEVVAMIYDAILAPACVARPHKLDTQDAPLAAPAKLLLLCVATSLIAVSQLPTPTRMMENLAAASLPSIRAKESFVSWRMLELIRRQHGV